MDYISIKKILKTAICVGILIFFVALIQKNKLPNKESLSSQLYQEPLQTKIRKDPFNVSKGGMVYTITPLYNYTLFGLVVSCYDTWEWYDWNHKKWKDFINVKDVCVIWGENAKTGVYQRMTFSNESFTCYYNSDDREVWKIFTENCLSNNHILSADKNIFKTLARVRKGDQIYLKGYLARYSRSDGTCTRGSSITRTDRGNGACETIYVTDFSILKRANSFWWFLYGFTKYIIISCFICLAIVRFKFPFGY